MREANEKDVRFLQSLLKKAESSNSSILLRPWFNIVLWLVCSVIFLIAFQWHSRNDNPVILFVVSGFVGISIGAIATLQNGERYWPLIKRHLDTESIKREIGRENT